MTPRTRSEGDENQSESLTAQTESTGAIQQHLAAQYTALAESQCRLVDTVETLAKSVVDILTPRSGDSASPASLTAIRNVQQVLPELHDEPSRLKHWLRTANRLLASLPQQDRITAVTNRLKGPKVTQAVYACDDSWARLKELLTNVLDPTGYKRDLLKSISSGSRYKEFSPVDALSVALADYSLLTGEKGDPNTEP